MEGNKLSFKDENENRLYGFSQIDLESLNKRLEISNERQKKMLWIFGIGLAIGLGIALYVLVRVESGNILANAVDWLARYKCS